MRLSRANKRDANEPEIVAALESIGCTVVRLDKPLDLLVGYRKKTFLLEVKAEGGRLTVDQVKFLEGWKGQAAVIREPEEAIKIVTGTCTSFKV